MIRCTMDNKNYHVKPDKRDVKAITSRIAGMVVEESLGIIAERLVQPYGRTICPAVFRESKRTNNTWDSQQLYGLDFDGGITLEEVLKRCKKYNLEPCFAYDTFSSVNNNKFRVFFCNDTEIRDYRLQQVIQLGLLKIFKEADQKCNDGSRLFYGGQNLLYLKSSARINPIDLLKELCRFIHDSDSSNASREIKAYC